MTIESFNLIEHFEYMKNFIPQPFMIHSDEVESFGYGNSDTDTCHVIKTKTSIYTLTKPALKKLVDSLGVKVKLLDAVCSETNVIDLAMPIIDKLLKCFADCFVFYVASDDPLTIIDLNVNTESGEEGTKYENGPSPWQIESKDNPTVYTCFVDFLDKYGITDRNDILVRADDLMSGNNVTFDLFIPVSESTRIQPMLSFNGKFSNLNGFSDIHTVLVDKDTNIRITFPMNYAKDDGMTFDDMWKKAEHLVETTDLSDYIFKEVNELAASNDTPLGIRKFICEILTDSPLNVNQPISAIMEESVRLAADMKPSKAKRLKNNVGNLIGFCCITKHFGCRECGHVDRV